MSAPPTVNLQSQFTIKGKRVADLRSKTARRIAPAVSSLCVIVAEVIRRRAKSAGR